MDTAYELTRITDHHSFYRKMALKRFLYKTVGELYIGKRAKLRYFRRWFRRLTLPTDASILEAGSGDGVFAFYVAQRFKSARVTGLELNPIEAEVCQRLANRERLDNLLFASGSLTDAQWEGRFDFIYCLDVLEHIADDDAAISAMHKALKPGGQLLVHVPNRYFMRLSGELATVPDEDAWKINPGHVRNGYAPEELRGKLEQGGFDVKEIEPTQSHPLTIAHRITEKFETWWPLRLLMIPLLDCLIWLDMRKAPTHGNTVWAWAQRP